MKRGTLERVASLSETVGYRSGCGRLALRLGNSVTLSAKASPHWSRPQIALSGRDRWHVRYDACSHARACSLMRTTTCEICNCVHGRLSAFSSSDPSQCKTLLHELAGNVEETTKASTRAAA